MEDKKQNNTCSYCHKDYYSIYTLKRHQDTCKVKGLIPFIFSQELIQDIFQKHFNISKISHTNLSQFILSYFINKQNYHIVDKSRFIAIYINKDNEIIIDKGFKLILFILKSFFLSFQDNEYIIINSHIFLSDSKYCELSPKIKNYIVKNIKE